MNQYKCLRCGKEFKDSHKNRKYCSRVCLAAMNVVNSIKNLPKGKTYIEMFGKEKAELKANKCAETLRRHPKLRELALIRGNANGVKMLGKTLSELHGVEEAKRITEQGQRTRRERYTPEQISEIARGCAIAQNSKFYGKRGNVQGIRSDSSYETTFIRQFLAFNEKAFSLSRANIGIRYEFKGKTKMYLPDFFIMVEGLICAILEVKDETRLTTIEKESAPYKMAALNAYCKKSMLTPCLYTEQHFPKVNPELSSVNELIQLTHKRFVEYVAEKVQRPAVEDIQANNTAVGREVYNV